MKTPQLTAIIADDEPILRYTLKKILADIWSDLDVVAMAATGQEAWTLIQEITPDVVFLDIKMPDLSGLQVAQRMQQHGLGQKSAIVFLTAYDEFALQAFERAAIDYLLKPVDENRLLQTRDRVLARHQAAITAPINLETLTNLLQHSLHQPTASRWLNVSKGEDIFVIDVESILYFQAEDKYTTVITKDSEQYLIRKSLRQLEDELDGDQFWRIHRGTLVQVAQIAKVEKTLTGQLRLHFKHHKAILAVSRRFATRFKPC